MNRQEKVAISFLTENITYSSLSTEQENSNTSETN